MDLSKRREKTLFQWIYQDKDSIKTKTKEIKEKKKRQKTEKDQEKELERLKKELEKLNLENQKLKEELKAKTNIEPKIVDIEALINIRDHFLLKQNSNYKDPHQLWKKNFTDIFQEFPPVFQDLVVVFSTNKWREMHGGSSFQQNLKTLVAVGLLLHSGNQNYNHFAHLLSFLGWIVGTGHWMKWATKLGVGVAQKTLIESLERISLSFSPNLELLSQKTKGVLILGYDNHNISRRVKYHRKERHGTILYSCTRVVFETTPLSIPKTEASNQVLQGRQKFSLHELTTLNREEQEMWDGYRLKKLQSILINYKRTEPSTYLSFIQVNPLDQRQTKNSKFPLLEFPEHIPETYMVLESLLANTKRSQDILACILEDISKIQGPNIPFLFISFDQELYQHKKQLEKVPGVFCIPGYLHIAMNILEGNLIFNYH